MTNFHWKKKRSFRRKFNIRITEVQEQLTDVMTKASNLEKIKQRLQLDLDQLNGEVDKVEQKKKL